MSSLARSCRTLAVGIVAAAAIVSMTQVADAAPAGLSLPLDSPIAVDTATNEVFLVGHAKGFQIYTCNGATSTWGPASTPDAKLFDDNGELVAKHFAGPTWEAKDGSAVKGTVTGRVDSPTPATAIPWLRLSTTPVPGSPGGLLTKTTFIQRVATTGGVAPTAGCNSNTAGKKEKVPYTADYYFWEAKASA